MTITIGTFLDRIAAMEEAITLTTVDTGNVAKAFPVALYSQDSFPYWTNELLSATPVGQDQFFDRYNITIRARLFRGRVNEGYSRNLESACQQDVFAVLAYFRSRKNLTLNAGDNPLTGFIPGSFSIASQGATRLSEDEFGSIYDISFSIGDRAGA